MCYSEPFQNPLKMNILKGICVRMIQTVMLGSRISISKNRVRLSQIRVTDPFWENMKASNADFTEIDFVINGDGSLSLEDYPKTTQRKVQRNETFGNFVFKDQ